MKRIGNVIFILILMSCVLIVYFNIDDISDFFTDYLLSQRKALLKESNQYKRNYRYITFSNDEDYIPYTKEDIKNIYFNILNNGWDSFTFYCPKEYTNCLDDVKEIGTDKIILSEINDYVSPFNSYNETNTVIYSNGQIDVEVSHKYTEQIISEINRVVSDVIKELDLKNKSKEEQVSLIHNYILEKTIYDKEAADEKYSPYDSTSGYGALIEGYAVCSGYADAMAIFLDVLNIPNIKISSENHVWNLVNIDNKWLHVDLTWDDVEIDKYKNNYFLITTDKLLEQDNKEHSFDKSFFKEAA